MTFFPKTIVAEKQEKVYFAPVPDFDFHSDIWLGLTSNSFESSASVFCSFIAANATVALNLFVNFLRFVVIFPCVFALAKLLFFHLNSCSHFWGTL